MADTTAKILNNWEMTMAGVLDGVDQRTNLVGENRLELLLFELAGPQRYGINVFKVQEVLQCPPLTSVPKSHRIVCGLTNVRGKTMPVLDLGMAIGEKPIEDINNSFMIITEYNRSTQGFLVKCVDRIVNKNWEDILPPPKGVGKDNYMTAVTRVDEKLVEILDVEKVLADMIGIHAELDDASDVKAKDGRAIKLLVVDDSSVARNQIKRTLDQLGMECTIATNGREALNMLKKMADEGRPMKDVLDLIISDIEMPEMDGYTLTTEIRSDERLKDIPVILHTSLSGGFNTGMVEKVGADKFVPKFHAEELASVVRELLAEKDLV